MKENILLLIIAAIGVSFASCGRSLPPYTVICDDKGHWSATNSDGIPISENSSYDAAVRQRNWLIWWEKEGQYRKIEEPKRNF